MRVRFWGVRGSVASPGPDTVVVGGNTSCVEVQCGDTRIILDAGTGLRNLGDLMLEERQLEAHLLLSHYHWDHIQGLPFFVPAYVPTARIQVIGAEGLVPVEKVLEHQMQAPVFPVPFHEVAPRFSTETVRNGDQFRLGSASVRVAKLNHPGSVMGYRIEHEGRSVVYATDTEHYSCLDQNLLKLAAGADLLIYDSMYTPEEYRGDAGPSRIGWGHSTFAEGCELARVAGVGTLALFHHDPKRTDAQVSVLVERAKQLFDTTIAAREGTMLDLTGLSRAA